MKIRPLRLSFFAHSALCALAFAGLAGCAPKIGDSCVQSTDCSIQGDRLCDTSEPNGYCTVFNCQGNLCPDQAACVLFNPNVQGCGFTDRAPSRTGRTFCLAQCQSDSDCRTSDGYICARPTGAPWNALILDDDQSQRVCIIPPDAVVGDAAAPGSSMTSGGATPPVCSANGPEAGALDAASVELDASQDAAIDAALDAAIDAAIEGGAADAAGGDAGIDAAGDGASAGVDAGPVDASDSGG